MGLSEIKSSDNWISRRVLYKSPVMKFSNPVSLDKDSMINLRYSGSMWFELTKVFKSLELVILHK